MVDAKIPTAVSPAARCSVNTTVATTPTPNRSPAAAAPVDTSLPTTVPQRTSPKRLPSSPTPPRAKVLPQQTKVQITGGTGTLTPTQLKVQQPANEDEARHNRTTRISCWLGEIEAPPIAIGAAA